jgi:hypothetical protein
VFSSKLEVELPIFVVQNVTANGTTNAAGGYGLRFLVKEEAKSERERAGPFFFVLFRDDVNCKSKGRPDCIFGCSHFTVLYITKK